MSIVNPHDPATWPVGYKRITVKLSTEDCSPEQLTSLRKIYDRAPLDKYAHRVKEDEDYPTLMNWGTFRDSAQLSTTLESLMVYWCGMWLGIERDGRVHS